MTTATTPAASKPIGELAKYFLRLGLLGFGGPVALVGQMERELVAERGWLTKEQMREAIAICQSLPGPLAIQVGIYVSYLRGGFWGAWVGGWAFIFPNFVIVAALGALYVYLRRPQAGDGGVLRRKSGRHRTNPSFLLSAREARDGRLAAMVDRGSVSGCHTDPTNRGGVAVHRCRHCRYVALWQRFPPSTASDTFGVRSSDARAAYALGRVGVDHRQAPVLFPQGRLPHLWQRLGDCPVSGTGVGGAIWLARSAPVFDCGCDRHGQPGPRRDHRHVRRLSGWRILGLSRLDDRYFPALLYSCAGGGANSGASPRQCRTSKAS